MDRHLLGSHVQASVEPPENVVLLCDGCGSREWEVRADCVLQCVLCENTHDMAGLVEQHKTGAGLWMNTDH